MKGSGDGAVPHDPLKGARKPRLSGEKAKGPFEEHRHRSRCIVRMAHIPYAVG
jgi:hypothetical protein